MESKYKKILKSKYSFFALFLNNAHFPQIFENPLYGWSLRANAKNSL